MIRILARLLIPNHDTPADEAVRRAYGTLCSALGILLNLLLFAGKYLAGTLSGSIAVIADAFNNLTDAGSSVITLLGIRLAGKRPDPHHPYGHGRYEYVSGVAVSALIVLVGLELGQDSLLRILRPTPVDCSPLAIGILLASVGVKLYIFAYNRAIGREIDSPAMGATALDALSDVLSTLVVLASMLLSRFFGLNADGWGGLFVAVFVLYAGLKSTKETLSPLLGHAPDPALVDEIESIVLRYDEIVDIHDLMVHDYGPGRRMVTLHAEVPENGRLTDLHDAVDSAEMELAEKLGCTATIHMDPVPVADDTLTELRDRLTEYAQTLWAGITIHDLRITDRPDRSSLIFDAVLPFDAALSPEELQNQLSAFVTETWPAYTPAITIDRPYRS